MCIYLFVVKRWTLSFLPHTIAPVVNGRLCYSCSYYENEIKRDYECVTSPANVTTAKTVSCPDDSYCFTKTQYYKGNDYTTQQNCL